MFRRLLAPLARRSTRPGVAAGRRLAAPRPELECLEERALLSAASVRLKPAPDQPGKQVVVAQGTPRNDTISVLPCGTGYGCFINGVRKMVFNPSRISRIEADGLAGNDTVKLPAALNVNAVLKGGAGNDRLTGGRGVTTSDGGAGNDFLYGGSNGDFLAGGEGDDQLFGYGGNDILAGGGGVDRLTGGGGQNYMLGGAGIDLLVGNLKLDQMFQDTADLVKSVFTKPWYGNYLGPGNNGGTPISSLDWGAYYHDLGYDLSGASGIWGALFDTSVSGDDWALAQDAWGALWDPNLGGLWDRGWALGTSSVFGTLGFLKE